MLKDTIVYLQLLICRFHTPEVINAGNIPVLNEISLMNLESK